MDEGNQNLADSEVLEALSEVMAKLSTLTLDLALLQRDSSRYVDTQFQWEELRHRVDEIFRRLRRNDNDLDCSAVTTTIGDSIEGSEAADTTTFSGVAGTPVTMWVVGRVGYFHAGNQKLYAYVRPVTLFACTIGIETRVEVDAPEDCIQPE